MGRDVAYSEEDFIEKNSTVGYKNFSMLSKSQCFGSQIHVFFKICKKLLNLKMTIEQLYS